MKLKWDNLIGCLHFTAFYMYIFIKKCELYFCCIYSPHFNEVKMGVCNKTLNRAFFPPWIFMLSAKLEYITVHNSLSFKLQHINTASSSRGILETLIIKKVNSQKYWQMFPIISLAAENFSYPPIHFTKGFWANNVNLVEFMLLLLSWQWSDQVKILHHGMRKIVIW